ncbi:unnamed protein product, partial [Rotaria sp. Silwood2]
ISILYCLPYRSRERMIYRQYTLLTSENIRRFLRWFGWEAEPIVSSLLLPPPTTTIQKIKRFFSYVTIN